MCILLSLKFTSVFKTVVDALWLAMARSNLSIRISICQLIERLNDDDCLDIVRLLSEKLGVTTSRMVNKIITQSTQSLTNESLIGIEAAIKNTYSLHSTNNKISVTSNNETATDKILFPLLRLPNDLLIKTSSFLTETEIFQFEQCCRLFYKIINNISYLNKCNNFKNFTITKERLHQMRQEKYDFFKYSKATQLTSSLQLSSYYNWNNDESSLIAVLNNFETTMNKMKKMGSYDEWWTSLFKSISYLDLASSTDIGVLISVLPIEILFNPKISHLKKIKLAHCTSRSNLTTWNNYMNKFEEKYLQCKKEWNSNIKSLQCIKHRQSSKSMYTENILATTNPRFIDAKHVWMKGIKVDLTDDKFLTTKCNPGMKILTIESVSTFVTGTGNDSSNINNINNRGLKIETMRLLTHLSWTNYDICNKQVVIDSLNLQNSLKNLTLELVVMVYVKFREDVLENVILKKYYCNLQNVNIIFETDQDASVDQFFKLLKKNQNILKHQFKQLNIALVKNIKDDKFLYFVMEWNKDTDDKRLNQLKKQFDQIKVDDQNQKLLKEKYLSMREQWLD